MNSVQLFTVFALVLAISQNGNALLTDEQKMKILEIGKACMEETGISMELVQKMKSGELIDDPKVKAQLLCFSKKIGLQNDAGELQPDVIKAKLMSVTQDEAKAQEVMDKCLVTKDTPEDSVFETVKCLNQYVPKGEFD